MIGGSQQGLTDDDDGVNWKAVVDLSAADANAKQQGGVLEIELAELVE